MKIPLLILFSLITHPVFSLQDTLKNLTFSGYGELYYSYDFSSTRNREKDDFLYNHKRNNEVNANLILLRANYTTQGTRANFVLMAGNYAQYNLRSEPTWAQFIHEANVGVKLFSKKNVWLDAGIFPSHIGFESATSADCWTLTRSILAENSPYYETGLKLSFKSKNEQLVLSGLLLNGWQKIQKPDYFQRPSFGLQITYSPLKKIVMNYSNFMGTDKPDTLRSFRHFHNFYAVYEATSYFGIIVGFDIGFEKSLHNNFENWYAPVLILKQKLHSNLSTTLRLEYYHDPKEIMVKTVVNKGFKVLGLSSNIDYLINDNIQVRLEGKMYRATENIFSNHDGNILYSITTNMTIKM